MIVVEFDAPITLRDVLTSGKIAMGFYIGSEDLNQYLGLRRHDFMWNFRFRTVIDGNYPVTGDDHLLVLSDGVLYLATKDSFEVVDYVRNNVL